MRDQTGSCHSLSQTLSISGGVCSTLPSQAPPFTILEACAETFRHSGGRVSEARVDNRATERGLGVSMASFIIQPLEHLLPSRPWDLKIAPAPSRWLLVSMYVKPHTCMEVFMHFAPSRAAWWKEAVWWWEHLSTYSGEGKTKVAPWWGRICKLKRETCASLFESYYTRASILHPSQPPQFAAFRDLGL